MNHTQYTLIKIPLRELIRNDFDLQLTEAEEINREYLVAQGDSLLFDQIERLRGEIAENTRSEASQGKDGITAFVCDSIFDE